MDVSVQREISGGKPSKNSQEMQPWTSKTLELHIQFALYHFCSRTGSVFALTSRVQSTNRVGKKIQDQQWLSRTTRLLQKMHECPRKASWPAPPTSLLQQEVYRQIINRLSHRVLLSAGTPFVFPCFWVQNRTMTEPASETKDAEDHCHLQPNCSVFSHLQEVSRNLKITPFLSHHYKSFSFSEKHFYQQQPIPETATFSISRDGSWQQQDCTVPS